MDVVTLGIIKKMPDTAAGRAEEAATRAEAAAQSAAEHNQGISVEGTGLVITEREGD